MKRRTLALFLSLVMALTLIPFTAFAYDGTVKDIEFLPEKPYSVYFESGGYFDTDEDEQNYYRYNYVGYSEGDELVIIDENDNRITYAAAWDEEDGEWYFVAGNGDRIALTGPDKEVDFIDEQDHPGKHLQFGENNNSFFIEYKGVRKAIPVTVIDNPVDAIEFTPCEPVEMLENVNGHWDHNDEDGDFFNYDLPAFRPGDKLIVYFKEAEAVEYTYRDVDNEINFYDENDNLLPDADEISRTKYNKPWTIDGDNEFYIEYSGREISVPVTIVANSVTGIAYTRAQADEYIENDTYHDSWDNADYYRRPNFCEDDTLTVYEGEKSTVYICKYDTDIYEYYFESADGKRIETNGDDCVSFFDTQRETPWVVGSANVFYAEYRGQRATLYATVKESNVASISYKSAEPVEYIKNTNGYDSDGTFVYWLPSIMHGDILSVTDKKGNKTDYTYGYNQEAGESVFTAENGDVIFSNDVHFTDKQYEQPWTVGNENPYTVSYQGASITLYATVKENPVESIAYTPIAPAVIYDTQGWEDDEGNKWYQTPFFSYGDVLTVNYTNGTSKNYTYDFSETLDEDAFIAGDGEAITDVRSDSDQWETPWTLGENNYYIEYLGKRVYLTVTLKENDLKAIRIEPVNPVTVYEGTQHEAYSWMVDRHYMAYDIPPFEEGDKLILVDKNDREKEYTYQQEGEEGLFKCGDEVLDDMLMIYHFQFDKAWEVDQYNCYYAELQQHGISCEVPVTVIASDVKSIRFTMSKPEELVFSEQTDGEWKTENGRRYFAYTWQNKDFVGSTLTVTYKDDTTDVYTLKFDFEGEGAYFENEDGDILTTYDVPFWDEQAQEPWTPSAQGKLYMRYKGATCEIPVIIKHSYEKKIIAPTCTEKGRTEFTCTACGDTYVESYTDALGHKWNGGKVTKKATPTATGVKTYACTVCGATRTESIPKCAKYKNPMTVKAKAVSFKASVLKKKNQSVKASKAFTVKKAQGKVTYKKASGNKSITVSSSGKITVKKGLKKGTYKVKVKVTAKGNASYKSITKTVTIKIKVK